MSDTLIRAPTQLPQSGPPKGRRSAVPGLTVTVLVLALALVGLTSYVGMGVWRARSTATIVNDLAAAWSAPDGGGVVAAELYTPGALLEVTQPGLRSQAQGRQEIAAMITASVARGLVMTPGAMTRDGDAVTFHFTLGTPGDTSPAAGVSVLELSGAQVRHQLIVVLGEYRWVSSVEATRGGLAGPNTSTAALEGARLAGPNTSTNAVEGLTRFAGPNTSTNAVERSGVSTVPNTSTAAVERQREGG